MSLPIVPLFVRRWFNRAFTNGETFDYASLDGTHADLVEGHNQVKARLDAISTAAGSLKYALVSINSFTATASQTAFTVTTYDSTAGASFALVFIEGVALAQASITQTSDTVITLPAQAVNAKVVIAIFGSGNGTSQLASTSANQGASLIGINDAGAYLTATNVETALQEIAANLGSSAYLSGILTLTGYLLKSGGTMTGAIAMGANKITGLAAGTAASNDAARMADITSAAIVTTITAYLSANYLALVGGTMTGAIAMGTSKITGLGTGTASTDAVNKAQMDTAITAGTALLAPVGSIFLYGASAIPTGFLDCDASAVSRTTYAALFAVIGTVWGAGDGVTTFNVPDMRGRAPIGRGSGAGLTARALADSGGAETHPLVKAELPTHVHTIVGDPAGPGGGVGIAFTTGTTTTTGNGSADGLAGTAHNNMQPYKAVVYIIKY